MTRGVPAVRPLLVRSCSYFSRAPAFLSYERSVRAPPGRGGAVCLAVWPGAAAASDSPSREPSFPALGASDPAGPIAPWELIWTGGAPHPPWWRGVASVPYAGS